MNDQTAKAGFKTFVITLGVSLALFGVLYYFISASTTKESNIENTEVSENNSNALAVATTETVPTDTTKKDERAAVFDELTKNAPSAVLAASSQSTTSVPVTGSTEITIALLSALGLLGYGALVYIKNPRRAAIENFENSITKRL
jgi:hypothetical protein